MKDNREDMKVAEKISQLDTLSAGIVYGKEEAWDKLQARMDKKKTAVVPIRFWATAAALLVLFIGIAVWHSVPDEEVAVRAKENINAPVVQQPPIVEPLQQTGVQPEKAMAIKTKQALPQPRVRLIEAKETITAIVQPEPVVQEEHNVASIVAANTPAPVTPAPQMKIIHINDLERGDYNSTSSAGITPGIATAGMPVVHINEVEREALEIKEILRNNRVTLLRIPFSKPNENEVYRSAEDNSQRIQFLKLRNTQN